ncbi:MAG: hypothetical protein ACXVYB_13845, partial [Arthrobacter sp.]
MSADCLVEAGTAARLQFHLRFLHLQTRTAERATEDSFTPVEELTVGTSRWLSWDEAAEQEITLGPFTTAQLAAGITAPIAVGAHENTEVVRDSRGASAGRLVRRRRKLSGALLLSAVQVAPAAEVPEGTAHGPLWRISIAVRNTAAGRTTDKRSAVELSFIGTHLLLSAYDADFVSVIDPPAWASEAAAACRQNRCWPVLAGPEGQRDVLLLSPIILYDHPAVAPESSVELFDATEIDEILTLRVLTLTDEEKAEARSTDPRAAAIIERCENMTAGELQQLHGILRNPHALSQALEPGDPGNDGFPTFSVPGADPFPDPGGDAPWWDPARDAAVDPESDTVLIDGMPVSRGSRVLVAPQRRADAQAFFFAGQTGRVTGVHFDVDGGTPVAG